MEASHSECSLNLAKNKLEYDKKKKKKREKEKEPAIHNDSFSRQVQETSPFQPKLVLLKGL